MQGARWNGTILALAMAVFALFAILLVQQPSRAAVSPGEQLFQKNDCTTCHAVDHKVVGPSYQDVAKKFAGQANAAQTLIDAIKKGHVGTWGQVPMPPHPRISDADLKEIVDWILSLK
jgi:cytochrome c